MSSTFHGLEVAKRALFAQQAALSTTSQNIANANTTGYSRQRAEMQATRAIPYIGLQTGVGPGQIGTGVEVTKIVRLREDYLDVQYRNETPNLGYWGARSDTLSKIEEVMNEPSDSGLVFTMDEFWKGWQELAKDPSSASARAVVQQKGVTLAQTFNSIYSSLDQIQADMKNVITTKVNDINSIATQIASLNDQIARLVPNNYEPNDLYDQRDVLIDQLSKLVNVKVTQGNNGTVNIMAGDGVIVNGINANKLTIDYDPSTGFVDPDSIQIGGNKVTFTSGELLGNMESFGMVGGGTKNILPSIKEKLNEMVSVFSKAVNDIHSAGMNLDNINGVSNTKVAFFVGTTAKDLAVNPDIIKSLNLIAAAKVESGGQSSVGNGKNAVDIANIKFLSLNFSGTTATTDDFYRNLIGQIGVDSQQAQRMADNSNIILHQVDNRRQSVSGVSLDEEMANMIKFQQAYNAAARAVTSIDECLDKIINGMGRVGL